jgi:hypothetical protein
VQDTLRRVAVKTGVFYPPSDNGRFVIWAALKTNMHTTAMVTEDSPKHVVDAIAAYYIHDLAGTAGGCGTLSDFGGVGLVHKALSSMRKVKCMCTGTSSMFACFG